MKKLVVIIAVLAILTAIGFCTWRWLDATYVQLERDPIRRDLTQFTITGDSLPSEGFLQRFYHLSLLDARNVRLSPREFDHLQQLLPDCEILWQIPFQGQQIPHDTTALTVSSLSAEDQMIIPYFRNLKTVHAENCRDYAVLTRFQNEHPQLQVLYDVELNGTAYSSTAAQEVTKLTLQDADIGELANVLPCFSNLQEVTFTGKAPDNDAIYALMCQYPKILFQWELTVLGITTPNTATNLNFSGIPMEGTGEVESILKYFPNLERVEMCDCGISSEEMDALSQRHPEIRFVWTIKIGRGTLRTDVTAFIPFKLGHTMDTPLSDKDCTELKYCVDMVCLDMGHMRIKDLSFLRHMPKLKYLIVADIPCTDFSPLASLTELIYLEIFMTKFTDHELLLGMTKLEDLNIGATYVKDVSALHQMTNLKRLWLPGVLIDNQQYADLRAALPNTQIVRFARHSTDQGWRNHKNYRDMRDLLGMFYME